MAPEPLLWWPSKAMGGQGLVDTHGRAGRTLGTSFTVFASSTLWKREKRVLRAQPRPAAQRCPRGTLHPPERAAGLDAAVASFEGQEKPRRAAHGHVTSLLSPLQSCWQPPGRSPSHLNPLPSSSLEPSPAPARPSHALSLPPHTGVKLLAKPPPGWLGSGEYLQRHRGDQEHLSRRVCRAHPESKRAG